MICVPISQQFARVERLHAALRADGHEHRRLHDAVRRGQSAKPRFRVRIGFQQFKHRAKAIFEGTLFKQWCQHPDFEHNLPLIMLHGERVIGEATLHQRLGGWKRHIGLITVLTHPNYRGRDVAKMLVEEQVEIARNMGLCRLEAELNGERKIAIRALEQIGFQRLMKVKDYVLDMKAVMHDYVFMGMDLRTDEE